MIFYTIFLFPFDISLSIMPYKSIHASMLLQMAKCDYLIFMWHSTSPLFIICCWIQVASHVLAIVNNAVNINMNIVIVAAAKWWTLCDPMDCSSPGSSAHGISQSRILEWLAISFSRGSSQPRGRTCVSCIGRQVLYHWATRECWYEHWGVKVRCSPMWTLRCLYLFKLVSFFFLGYIPWSEIVE